MPLRVFREAPPEAAELDLEAFLAWLGEPALFHLTGASQDRCRVLCGGLHGNEPSGFHAIHRLLADPPPLPCDALLFLGNVPAALHDIPFTHRFLPGQEDMNRVWRSPGGSVLRALAREVLDALEALPCEAFVDLHNNSGHNPIYGVLLDRDPRCVALGRHWTRRFVVYGGQDLGTFLEQTRGRAPGVVIECGQAGDPDADARALAGARAYLSAEDPFSVAEPAEPVQAYLSVARIHVPAEVDLAFAEERTVADLTVSPRIDRYNFCRMEPGTRLAWRNERGRLVVLGNDGREVTDDYLEARDGGIYLRRAITPVMMTTDALAARADCLLYAAEPLEDLADS
ncbi:MAG: hypothetical protein D6731_14215 [Planctomycetota bacterium]|nr:MAG: hypothetical protein D6731_14215 [Planctomycetota bacterium]